MLKKHFLLAAGLLLGGVQLSGQTIYVSPKGNDKGDGSEKKPVATIARAQELARAYAKDINVEVILEDGVYYLPATVQFTSADSKEYPATVTYKARNLGKAIISGGMEMQLQWKKEAGNIYVAKVPEGYAIDQLYVDGMRQQMARFPNSIEGGNRNVYDTWVLSHNATPDPTMDPLQPDRIMRWQNPEGAYIHAMHYALWGDMHWYVKGKNPDGTLNMEGGWQNNRPSAMHTVYRMAENIKEELDVPGEWYYNQKQMLLYYMPFPEMNMKTAKVEIVRLKHLIELNGSKAAPVQGVNFEGLTFKHASRTFMENREPLLRSDWTVYRGGAVVFNGAEDCSVKECEFDHVGGNTIFVNNYNRRITIQSCYIHGSGANGIAFVGDPNAVRSPLFRYGDQNYSTIDQTAGPQSDNYPQDCTVDDCLITMTGRDEKQTAPIHISMSQRIRVSHCSLYDVPRAGININEGTFGGHIIEFCDVFNTVLETGDHGSFNSWGRDRFWTPDVVTISDQVEKHPDMQYWDVLEPNTLRYNRWRCDHGWDIDLDDGSSFYRIYCNVLLNGGLKMREGFDRIATNNVIINNSLHPHVWVRGSEDVFKHNIVFTAYQPAVMRSALGEYDRWGKELDYNLFATSLSAMRKYAGNETDMHSITGDPMFVAPDKGDYTVQAASPALKIGFRNFAMNDFGVRSKRLKEIAKTPEIPKITMDLSNSSITEYLWLGAILQDVEGEGLSAYGAKFGQSGVAFEVVTKDSEAAKLGFKSGDLMMRINSERTASAVILNNIIKKNAGKPCQVVIMRNQKETILKITLPKSELTTSDKK